MLFSILIIPMVVSAFIVLLYRQMYITARDTQSIITCESIKFTIKVFYIALFIMMWLVGGFVLIEIGIYGIPRIVNIPAAVLFIASYIVIYRVFLNYNSIPSNKFVDIASSNRMIGNTFSKFNMIRTGIFIFVFGSAAGLSAVYIWRFLLGVIKSFIQFMW